MNCCSVADADDAVRRRADGAPVTAVRTTAAAQVDLCSRVDLSLAHIIHTLHDSGAVIIDDAWHKHSPPASRAQAKDQHTTWPGSPRFGAAAAAAAGGGGGGTAADGGTTNNPTPQPHVDIAPIQEMMRTLGCDRSLDGRDGPSLSALSMPLHRVANGTPAQDEQESVKPAPTTRPRSQRACRQRRNAEPPSAMLTGECPIQAVVNGTCAGADDRGVLHIVVEKNPDQPDDPIALDESTNAATLLAISVPVRHLVLRNNISNSVLTWVLTNGNWANLTRLELRGLELDTLDFRNFNALPSLVRIDVFNSASVSRISTKGFRFASQLQRLHLRSNDLATLDPDAFDLMTALFSLDLGVNRLQELPPNIFRRLTALDRLFLDSNLISHVPAGTFHPLTQLTFLTLRGNDLTHVDSDMFTRLHRVHHFVLSDNPIRTIQPGAFNNLTSMRNFELRDTLVARLPPHPFTFMQRLTALELSSNTLTALPADVFHGLSRMTRILLSHNRITSLHPHTFRNLTFLKSVSLDKNKLTSLHRDLFVDARHLNVLSCQSNLLTSLPRDIFRGNTALRFLLLGANFFTSLDGVFDAVTDLRALALERNLLTSIHFDVPLPQLVGITLNDNRITRLPNLDVIPRINTLSLRNHRIRNIPMAEVLAHVSLRVLELVAAPDVGSVAHLDLDAFQPDLSTIRVETLRLGNVDITPMLPIVDALTRSSTPLQLEVLQMGWPGLDESVLPLSTICTLLASNVEELGLINTGYRSLDLCRGRKFKSVFLQNNRRLQSLSIHSSLSHLNVSGCHQLTQMTAPTIDILDITGTRLRPSSALCRRWGRTMLFAKRISEDLFNTVHGLSTLARCLATLSVLDVSDNAWIDNARETESSIGVVTALSDDAHLDVNGFVVPFRPNPPLFQLTNAAIQCNLELSSESLHQGGATSPVIVYAFRCTCARGFKMTSGGRCVFDEPDIAGIAAASVIGGLGIGLLMAWLSRRYRGLTKRIGLQEQLLVERDEEVMALKKAWEIEYDELRMIKRVAAGAFGVVFKAEWDTVTVAVKVLQQGVMMFDESTVLEFEKEVEFLQRTRHPHVVRFFGAGTDPNGSPFLVLEFVAMGSLKDLLGKDMEQVLMEVEARSTEGDGEDDVLVVGDTSKEGGGDRVWALKLRLLRDVASGMAFIHSLDQVHRDLKSGNVLVSARLRAKITDFGSIRQCLAGGSSASSSSTTATTATTAMTAEAAAHADDLTYSQAAGTATMNPSMTMTAGVGTPLYMAPEVLLGDKYNAKADVFSFGVLMWEVATQRVPDLIEQEKGSDFRGPMLATLSKLLQDGKRLEFASRGGTGDAASTRPPLVFHELARQCMDRLPRVRPSFEELCARL
ncbi:TKL protein kinase [Salpingoeca rosetta]|uniref:TKL protein kinase n=1 Tax=Salpingoeca rosetta (strain ATCC 50818 / BSB-021) TaxID=946362 RepID=F2UQK5_SALR5|nr:TKL protein kinase [Salpingoeca rosetta]EGD79910.1 TKL protein kinase [Salpingoeca rosetta]|eukprot:XP_004988531.1 TKL protein kinase [Salpingoeca rosetta]